MFVGSVQFVLSLMSGHRRLISSASIYSMLQQKTKPTAALQSLAEEIQSHILSFLPYRDILRCTFVSYNLLIDVAVLQVDTDRCLIGM